MDDEGGGPGTLPRHGTNWPEDTHLSATPPVADLAVGSMLPTAILTQQGNEWTDTTVRVSRIDLDQVRDRASSQKKILALPADEAKRRVTMATENLSKEMS